MPENLQTVSASLPHGREAFVLDNLRHWATTERIAAVADGQMLSYAQLQAQSEAIACMLHARYPRGQVVCLWGDKENEMLCYLFACIKAGHPYVVLSSYSPALRLQQILSLAQPCAVLCAVDGFPAGGTAEVLSREALQQAAVQYAAQTIDPSLALHTEEVLTYYFTSGSTGLPKCVPATMHSASSVALAYGDETQASLAKEIAHADEYPLKCLNIASYAFCSSVDLVFNNCARFGMTLYAVSHRLSSEYEALYRYIKQINPHLFDCSPQFLSMCLTDPDFNEQTLSDLRTLSVGGENLTKRIGLAFLQRFPHVPLFNAYGATEMCGGPMWCEVTEEMLETYDIMPIGLPIVGQCYLVDEEGQRITQEGVSGELVVTGSCLSPGYYGDAERTQQAFRYNEQGERCYHTNDLAQLRDGLYFYVGRKDNLVKVGGYRVEIEEVEAHIQQQHNVDNCAVIPVKKEGRTVMLAAFVVLKEQSGSTFGHFRALRQALLAEMQPYMVPQKILFVPQLPLNANGKTDRKALEAQLVITP